jgi:predicted nucleotidyltransferase
LNLNNQIIDNIKKFLIDNLNPIFIYIFGSAAEGYFREDSDIDIAFYSDKRINPYDLFIIKEKLADIVKKDIDLVNLKEASTVFKAQIVGKGNVIYFKDEKRLSDFRIRTLKEYVLLNEERKNILETYKMDVRSDERCNL